VAKFSMPALRVALLRNTPKKSAAPTTIINVDMTPVVKALEPLEKLWLNSHRNMPG